MSTGMTLTKDLHFNLKVCKMSLVITKLICFVHWKTTHQLRRVLLVFPWQF